jgi:phosphoenolpyruvate carboxykinase (GTP)
VAERCGGGGKAVESPIGWLPAEGAIDTTGLAVAPETVRALLAIEPADWSQEAESLGEFFAKFGDRVPGALERQRRALLARLG